MDALSWEEVIAISYTSADTEVTLTGAQLSVIVQMIALFNSPSAWVDYDTYADDIDAMVAELTALLTEDL